jgi:hypothetical protein
MLPAEIMSLPGALLGGVAALLVVKEQKSSPLQSSSLFVPLRSSAISPVF